MGQGLGWFAPEVRLKDVAVAGDRDDLPEVRHQDLVVEEDWRRRVGVEVLAAAARALEQHVPRGEEGEVAAHAYTARTRGGTRGGAASFLVDALLEKLIGLSPSDHRPGGVAVSV